MKTLFLHSLLSGEVTYNLKFKAFNKDFFRTISKSKGRFFAIFCMVAMGAGVFSGLNESSIDMKRTADVYYDDTAFMDIRLLSTYGFTDEDIDILSEQEYIEGIMPGHCTDALINMNESDYVVRVHSIPLSPSDTDPDYMNRPTLLEGRMPQKNNECLLSTHELEQYNIRLGDEITLHGDESLDDILSTRTYTVTGIVNSSYYISFVYGNSSIGNGTISYFMYVPEDSFCADYYTDVYARVTGADKLNCFGDEYEALTDSAIDNIEILSKERITVRYDDILTSATDALNEAKTEYADAEKEIEEKLNDAFVSLTDAKFEISEKEQELIDAKRQVSNSQYELNKAKNEIAKTEKEYEAGLEKYNQALSEYNYGLAEYNNALALYKQKKSEYEYACGIYNEKMHAYNDAISGGVPPEQLSAVYAELTAIKRQLDSANAELAVFETQLTENKAILDAGKKELDKSKAELENAKKLIEDGKKQIKNGQYQLNRAKAEIEDGEKQLADAKLELEDAWSEYYENYAEAQNELADARSEIEKAEKEIADLERPQWYILDRNSNSGFVSFSSDADRMKSLATVFPLIFFLVAALVALTTMTRMVDEERSIIGTYKALGYSSTRIMSRYLMYALLASLTGSLFGILLLSRLLPQVIWAAYGMLYIVPAMITKYDPSLVMISTGAATLCTMLSTYFACRNSLSEQPSSLLLPRAPKPGKRILLERIGFIWKHLSFNSKVTARNLFRYKKRMLMTLIGIAGCTALVLTGFGIKDSVADIVSNQFNIIYKYNVQVTTEGNLDNDALEILKNENYFSAYMPVSQRGTDIVSDKSTVSGYVMIPESSDSFEDFVLLRSRTTHEKVEFNEQSVIISEKTSDKLGVSVGDSIMIKDDDTYLTFTITGITENYIYHYLYIAPEIYSDVSGNSTDTNSVLCICNKNGEAEKKSISDSLLKCNNIGSVIFNEEYSTTFNGMIKTLNLVTVVLIVLAALLAFIVLYNLININITERRKELATIKVLGFYDREVSSYIFRETIILTVLGCILGLILGIFMHRLVITTIEVDMVMFGRTIAPLSYLFSALLTVMFSVIVELIMKPKMKAIDMVESLKSVD